MSVTSKELQFSYNIKRNLVKTNFQLIGEELNLKKNKQVGRCDLWLANAANGFLLSLELKVGTPNDLSKQKILKQQTFRYTEFMKYYFPEHRVYGLGAYKCIKHEFNEVKHEEIKFFDYWNIIEDCHEFEIDKLKQLICELN